MTTDRITARLAAEAARPAWLQEYRLNLAVKRKREAEDWLRACGWSYERRDGYCVPCWYSPDPGDTWDHGLRFAVKVQLEREARAYLEPVGWKFGASGAFDPLRGGGKPRYCSIRQALRRQKERDISGGLAA